MSYQPARKIKPSAVKNLCKFPSTKSFPSQRSSQLVLVESLLEKDYCFHLESDPNVQHYFPQPKTFVVNIECGDNREYTPDFEVHFRSGRKAYVEVKKDFDSLDAAYLHKLEVVTISMQQEGYEFLRVDESQIRIEPLLSNLRKLQRYRDRFRNLSATYSQLRKAVPSPRILDDLINNPLGIPLQIIYQLIVDGQIITDLDEVILTVKAEVRYA